MQSRATFGLFAPRGWQNGSSETAAPWSWISASTQSLNSQLKTLNSSLALRGWLGGDYKAPLVATATPSFGELVHATPDGKSQTPCSPSASALRPPVRIISVNLCPFVVPAGKFEIPSEFQGSEGLKGETGIEGVISEGPIFPGPSNHGQPDSRPLANAEFVVKQENSMVTSIKTDEQGRFRVLLSSGHYTVWSKGREGNGGNCSFEVDVVAGEIKQVKWNCDTGLR